MGAITLAQARTVTAAAFERGTERGLAPLTVAVLDPGGHLVLLERQDGSSFLRPQLATAKAWGVLSMGLPVRGLLERAGAAPAFFASLTALADGRMIPVPGGVPVRDDEGVVVGSVGISGDTSDNDEDAAVAGIRAAGLHPWLE